jgi:hypothetical protein
LCLCASCCQAYAHAALLITSTIKSEFSIWNEKHQLELQKIHCIFSTFFIKLDHQSHCYHHFHLP